MRRASNYRATERNTGIGETIIVICKLNGQGMSVIIRGGGGTASHLVVPR